MKLAIFALFCASQCLLADSTQLEQADQFFDATLYEQAIPLYRKILETSEDPSIQTKLAKAYFEEQQYPEVIALLEAIPPDAMSRETWYLLGMAYKRKGLFVESNAPLEKAAVAPGSMQQAALLELGSAYFHQGESRLAREKLEQVTYPMGQIYLARLDLLEGQPAKAQQRLEALNASTPHLDELLRYETAYWRGVAYLAMGHYPQAVESLTSALPQRNQAQAPWLDDCLQRLSECYIQLAKYSLAEQMLQQLRERNEQADLDLANLYLLMGKNLSDPTYTSKGLVLLDQPLRFATPLLRAKVLFLQSEYAANKEEALRQLTLEAYSGTPYHYKAWAQRGHNAYAQGISTYHEGKQVEALHHFQEATIAFEKAAAGLDPQSAGNALKFQAQALWHQGSQESTSKAVALLDHTIKNQADLLAKTEDPDEFYYLLGLFTAHLDKNEAESILKEGLQRYPSQAFAEKMHFLLGTVLYHKKEYPQAEAIFLAIQDNKGDALFWAAKSLEAYAPTDEKIAHYKRKVFEEYPTSSYAAEAYFFYYPYREYLQGSRAAMKHLQSFKDKYPSSPFLINAQYLLGMDFKRDRRTAEGKWIRKKDLNAAIDALQEAEETFDELLSAKKIPEEEIPYFARVRYRATLERALANLAIADESQGAKRQIFLDYAEEVFRGLVSVREINPSIQEEGSFWLAQTYMRQDRDAEAKLVLNEMIDKYKAAKITRGYYLSRVWYELGQIARRKGDPKQALEDFARSEDASKGKLLSTDQKIDLWIETSLCYKDLQDNDKAMLTLSKAINSDEVSSLRVKAMFLRAELYAHQGRHELARKQLEATSKKGGEWALKAKHKLDRDYGYQ